MDTLIDPSLYTTVTDFPLYHSVPASRHCCYHQLSIIAYLAQYRFLILEAVKNSRSSTSSPLKVKTRYGRLDTAFSK